MQRVDAKSRKELAQLLRHLVAGLITNDEFESRLPPLNDVAARQVFSEGAWGLYSDLHEHHLTGKWRLDAGQRKEVARWILFLETDLPYEWPIIPGWIWLALLPLQMLTMGATGRMVQRYLTKADDADLWPFRRKHDYERALRQPPFLHG